MKGNKFFFGLCLVAALQISAAEKMDKSVGNVSKESAIYNAWRSSTIPVGKRLYRLSALINTCNDVSCEYPWKRNPLLEVPYVNPDATIKDFKEHVITHDLSSAEEVDLKWLQKQWHGKHDEKKKPKYVPTDFYVEGCKESDQIRSLAPYVNHNGYQARLLSLRLKVIKPCFCILNGLKKAR